MSTAAKPTIKGGRNASDGKPYRYPGEADWPPELVIYELHRRKISLRQLSIRHRLHERSLAAVLRKPRVRGEKIIARALGLKPVDIWPSRVQRRACQ